MSTLKRELKIKFKEILDSWNCHDEEGLLADELSAAALKLFFPVEPEPLKPAFDVQKAGLEWQIAMGAEIKQEDLDAAQLEKSAVDAFESAFSIKGNWNWYPAKPQDERVWKKFREQVVKLYVADKDCFTKYVTWIAQPFVRGAMTSLQIKRNPQDFPDAWASFCMSTKYQPPRPSENRADLDANGIPMNYS